jgi:hypothetical protein
MFGWFHHRGGHLTFQTFALQLLGQCQREVSARGVAGQHDLVGLITLEAQPLIGVVAVVERFSDRVSGDHPVIDDEHRAVGVAGQRGDQTAVRIHTTRQKCSAVHVENDAALAVGGKHT